MLFILLSVILVLWIIKEYFKLKHNPPGPIRIPIIGNMIQLALQHPVGFIALDKLRKKYGDVMSLKLGCAEYVVLSSYDAIKLFFGGEDCIDRPCTGMWLERNFHKNLGILFSNGNEWMEMRKFMMKFNRSNGYLNREWLEKTLKQELTNLIHHFDQEIAQSRNRIIEFRTTGAIKISLANLICALMSGQRHSYNDQDLQDVVIAVEKFLNASSAGMAVMTAYPWLRFVMGKSLGYHTQLDATNEIHKYSRKLIKKHRELGTYENGKGNCFIDAFLYKMEKSKDNPDTIFTEEQFLVTVTDFFTTGLDTTGNWLLFAILLLLTHPEKQDKLYKEIDTVVGTRSVTIQDRDRMIYIQAVMLEVHRWGKIAISLAPRLAVTDIKYKSYLIKKGTTVVANMYPVLNNEKYFGDPKIFLPERFISKAGNLIRTKEMIPFGIGKRVCSGEVLARDSGFMYLATLIQNYEFQLPEEYNEKPPSLKLHDGLTTSPEHFRAIVVKRNVLEKATSSNKKPKQDFST